MKIVNAATMMDLDRRTIHEFGLPSLLLMERAALGIMASLLKHFEYLSDIHILAGTGNNGGDGLAIARLLYCQGYNVQIWLHGSEEKRTPDNRFQLELCRKLGLAIKPVVLTEMSEALEPASLIVDSLFGVGLCREITGSWAELIDCANTARAPKVAVDIPSGIHADTGQVLGTAIRATLTVSCALPKWGHLLDPGLDWIGCLESVDIGIPPAYYAQHTEEVLTSAVIKAWKPTARNKNAHKGTYGRLGIVAGSMGMSGAARLAATAAIETGVGLVFLYVPASIQTQLAVALPEVQVVPLKEVEGGIAAEALPDLMQQLTEMDAVLMGPGLGRHETIGKCVQELLHHLACSLVLDADALYHLAGMASPLKQTAILTPHPGELARLLAKSSVEIQANRVLAVRQTAKTYQAVTVLKGARTLIANATTGLWFNSGGNPGMARGGMGDVLAGLCAGLLAQGVTAEQAAGLAVYWHSLAGDLVAAREGESSLTVMRLLQALPQAWRSL